jgi:Uncharacterized conserved protein
MTKDLSEMSKEELWQLFPIFLTKHQDLWAAQYAEEKTHLETFLSPFHNVAINHIGSTVIPDIWAKPIVDILVEIDRQEDMKQVAQALMMNGYLKMSESANRMSFNRGYTKHGFADEVFHLHLRFSGDRDELLFRDYLLSHPDVAAEYETLKLSLWHRYEHDRDGYTDAKTEFVKRITNLAKSKPHPGLGASDVQKTSK